MVVVEFYEKPGCQTNRMQKQLLLEAGYTVRSRDLLTHPWDESGLLAFFGERPVPEWFNRAAPRVRDGAITPEQLDAGEALALLLEEPLLIRRPLLRSGTTRLVGFDMEQIAERFGIAIPIPGQDMESCSAGEIGPCEKHAG